MSGQDSVRPVAAADPAVLQAAAHCQARPRELRSQHSQHPGEAGGSQGLGGAQPGPGCGARRGPAPGSGRCCGFGRELLPPDFSKINPVLLRLPGLRLQRGCTQGRRTPAALRRRAMGICAGGCSPAGSCGGRLRGDGLGCRSCCHWAAWAAGAAPGCRHAEPGCRRDAGCGRDAGCWHTMLGCRRVAGCGHTVLGCRRDAGCGCRMQACPAGMQAGCDMQAHGAGMQDAGILCQNAGGMQDAGVLCQDAGGMHARA